MEDDRLETQLTKIQSFVNHCVMQTFNVLIGNIMKKKECIGTMILKGMLQEEFLQITDKLSSIYMKYSALSCVEESYNENNFLWDSTFYESLNKEQMGKYSNFDLSTFDYSKYFENHTLYDEDLPMFSSLIDAILYERYSHYLKCEIEKIELSEIKKSFQRHSTIVYDNIEPSQTKEKPVIVGNEINPFKSDFSEEQIEILTDCINEVKLFTTSVSPKITKNLFDCNLKGVLKSNNNRLLAYLMQSLNLRGYVTNEWQS
ncbi:MAG: hypothetical protein HG447_006130, partial [Prevotella sp.]|nr:hypothetical protein [Prevotella sp.]